MPPSVASAKMSPTVAGAVALDIVLKDVDEVNTHTSESVCSSSGTDTDITVTTTSGPHAVTHPPRLTANTEVTVSLGSATRALADFACSPTSPTPCDFPVDFARGADGGSAPTASTAGAAVVCSTMATTVSLNCCISPPSAETSVCTVTSPPSTVPAKKTPAPPPPIDFCRSAKAVQSMNNFMSSPLSEWDDTNATSAATNESVILSPASTGPDATLLSTLHINNTRCVTPVSATADVAMCSSKSNGSTMLKPPASLSALHAYSEPFHPLEQISISTSGNAQGPIFRFDDKSKSNNNNTSASLRNSNNSIVSTPHQGSASSKDYHPVECYTSPCTVGFGLGEDYHSGMPRLTNSPVRTMTGPLGLAGDNRSTYKMHWQGTGVGSYYFSHFTNPPAAAVASNLESALGGFGSGILADDGYCYTPSVKESNSSSSASKNTRVSSGTTGRISGVMDGCGGGPWAQSSVATMGGTLNSVGAVPPTYSGPQQLFFGDCPPPALHAGTLVNDYDYSNGGNLYEDAAFGEQGTRFASYVPQEVQCVEHLEDLNYICQSILAEAAVMQQQYQRWCCERQYLAEDAFEDDELERKMVVALDLEGRSLGRSGSICIITLATYSTVYIIDMVLLGSQALADTSALKAVLESNNITKLMFDCRADCDALFFLYHVRLRNVCDLQISSCFALFPMTRHLPGMKDAFRALGLFADEDTDIKNAGRHLFNPDSGGSFDRWEERPLTDILLRYCAVDVKYFFLAKLLLWNHLDEGFSLGEARLASVCAGNFVGCSKSNSLRDFEMH